MSRARTNDRAVEGLELFDAVVKRQNLRRANERPVQRVSEEHDVLALCVCVCVCVRVCVCA